MIRRPRIQEIQEQIEKLYEEKHAIQAACPHPEIVLKHDKMTRCITPEYDVLATQQYRTIHRYHCGLCDKYWVEDVVHE